MTASSFRSTVRWFHIAVALFVGAYFYSPLHGIAWALQTIQFALIPLLLLSGLALWKQSIVMKWLK